MQVRASYCRNAGRKRERRERRRERVVVWVFCVYEHIYMYIYIYTFVRFLSAGEKETLISYDHRKKESLPPSLFQSEGGGETVVLSWLWFFSYLGNTTQKERERAVLFLHRGEGFTYRFKLASFMGIWLHRCCTCACGYFCLSFWRESMEEGGISLIDQGAERSSRGDV